MAKSELQHKELRVVGHSSLIYWWPVWVTALLFAFLTWQQGVVVSGSDVEMRVHPNEGLGVFFFLLLSMVILVTNVSMRGMVAVVVVLSTIVVFLLLLFFKQWDDVFELFGIAAIYLNQTFYVLFGGVLLVLWAAVVAVFDRLSFYRFKPGQLTHVRFQGVGKQSWNTSNMKFEKVRDDPFRHWILGFGAGDLHITTVQGDRLVIANVLFVGSKIRQLERLIAVQPDRF